MNDEFDLFIEDSVDIAKVGYDDMLFKTKRLFFDYLMKKKSADDFDKRLDKIWKNVDHSFMKQRIEELDRMIKERDLKDNEIKNINAKFKEIYELTKMGRYEEVEKYFKSIISDFYKVNLRTLEKEYIDEFSYLSKGVKVYDQVENTIAYHNKDGTVRSWHNIADYCSMLFNTNLNRSGWNRTLYDADLLERNIVYLPAHMYACPLCINYQGKLYSLDGTYGEIDGYKYVPYAEAVDGGVGHPNCRHQWELYWDTNQLQKDKFNTSEWDEKYKQKQKSKALERKINKLENDKTIYKKLGNYEELTKTQNKILKLLKKSDEIETSVSKS